MVGMDGWKWSMLVSKVIIGSGDNGDRQWIMMVVVMIAFKNT